jgi:hypothetical protein
MIKHHFGRRMDALVANLLMKNEYKAIMTGYSMVYVTSSKGITEKM